MPDWMQVLGSSNVIAIKYHEPSRECYVKFIGDQVYCYEDVPQETWEEFVHSGSKGRFVHVVLKRGFKYHRVTEAPKKEAKDAGSSTGSTG